MLQMLFASVVEDKMERAIYLTPFSSRSLEDVVGRLPLSISSSIFEPNFGTVNLLWTVLIHWQNSMHMWPSARDLSWQAKEDT